MVPESLAADKELVVRPCRPSDLEDVARLAARLVREHHSMDPARFLIFENIEEGYVSYLGSELENKRSVVLVAVKAEAVVGYAYGRIEPRDWNILRERCGALHDIYVDEHFRRQGIAARLVDEIVRRLAGLGAPRVVLMTAVQNVSAHKLFQQAGFRTTMYEMTKECEGDR